MIKPRLPILNRAHPLAQGLVSGYMLYEGGGTIARPLRNTIPGSIGSSIVWVGRPSGVACEFDGTSNAQIKIFSDFDLNGRPLTLVSRIHLGSSSEHGTVIGLGDLDAGFKIGVGSGDHNTNGNNLILLVDQEAWIDTGESIGTGDHQVSVSWSDGQHYRIGLDGKIVQTGSQTYRTLNDLSFIGGSDRTGRYFTDCIYFGLFYGRQLGESELTDLWTNPYQFLAHNYVPAMMPMLEVVSAGSTVELSWTDNSENETGFSIERSTTSAIAGFAEIDTVGNGVTTYDDTGLAAGTYWYRVRALSTTLGNSEYSNVAEITVS